MKKLPLIKLTINPEDGSFVSAISLVQNPAVESSFIAFSKQGKITFATNDERMELLGVAMKADTPIYRNSPETGEYACIFDADTVRKIAQDFAKQGFFQNLNIEHSDKSAKSFIYQSFIVDSSRNIFPPKGIEANDNDWIIGVKVIDPQIWSEIKSGEPSQGFSIEGVFKMIDTHTTINLSKKSDLDDAIDDLVNAVNTLIS